MRTHRGDESGLPWRLRDLVLSLAMVLGMIGIYAYTEHLDSAADRELEQIARAERNRLATQAALPPKVREAYAHDQAADDDQAAEERRCMTRRDGRLYCYRSDPR